MKRTLIKQDAFERLANSSVTAAEHELAEAAPVLARATDKDHLKLHSFTGNVALYETLDGTYVHAGYDLKDDTVTFTDIEELIVDSDSKKQKMKGILSEMLSSVLTDNGDKAKGLFSNYMEMYCWTEAKKKDKKEKKLPPWLKKGGKKDKKEKKHPKEKFAFFKGKAKKAGKKIEEAYTIAENVLDYVEYMQVGPALSEAVHKMEDGQVTHLRIPSLKKRNEGKLLSFDWKTLNHKVKVFREQALSLYENEMFCKAMSDLRRQNRFNNLQGLEEVLENVVQAFPMVLYAAHAELSQVIGEALKVAGVEQFDDQTCEFMAEGILRKAQESFKDRTAQILHLASAPKCEGNIDPYEHFQTVVGQFYPTVDQKFGLERKVFEDLYKSLEGLYKTADRRNDESLKQQSGVYLNELADVLNSDVKPDLELAEEVADWLATFIETNLESQEWGYQKPHISVTGDHPAMKEKAAKKYSPSQDFSGDWGDELPMIGQDNMSYKGGKHSKEARGRSWGNIGGKDVDPVLRNPAVPNPYGDYTMKGEKGVDKDTFGQHHGSWQSSSTWPNLRNIYCPDAETPKTYKMNKGKEKDLVVDK